LLDSCLHHLEDAHERDEKVLSTGLARLLEPHVPSLLSGLPITEAIDTVLSMQAQYLNPPVPGLTVHHSGGESMRKELIVQADGEALQAGALDQLGARALTERIRSATHHVCLLLLEAHDRQAWSRLGYGNWTEYVRHELGMSRTRSYELLDQARVLLAIQSAAALSAPPTISAYAAEQIKSGLEAVVGAIERRTAGVSEDAAMRVVEEVVQEHRARAGSRRPERLSSQGGQGWEDNLKEVIELLARMPPVEDMIGRIPEAEAGRLCNLAVAVGWLADLVRECREAADPSNLRAV
jgi:hypothetical protein